MVQFFKKWIYDMLQSLYQITTLEEFHRSQYLQDNEDPKVYFLPEIHGSMQQMANAKFISEIAQKTFSDRILILVEGVAAGEASNCLTNKQTHQLHLYNLGNIETKGWDIPVDIALEYSQSLSKINRELENIETKIREDVVRTGGKNYPAYKQEKENKSIELQIALNREQSTEELTERVHNSFQTRNYVMMNTVQKALNIYDVIFVIAGEFHLKSENNPNKNDERYSLDPLYEYVDGIPAVIMHHVPISNF